MKTRACGSPRVERNADAADVDDRSASGALVPVPVPVLPTRLSRPDQPAVQYVDVVHMLERQSGSETSPHGRGGEEEMFMSPVHRGVSTGAAM
jgi:hypothetical protein